MELAAVRDAATAGVVEGLAWGLCFDWTLAVDIATAADAVPVNIPGRVRCLEDVTGLLAGAAAVAGHDDNAEEEDEDDDDDDDNNDDDDCVDERVKPCESAKNPLTDDTATASACAAAEDDEEDAATLRAPPKLANNAGSDKREARTCKNKICE